MDQTEPNTTDLEQNNSPKSYPDFREKDEAFYLHETKKSPTNLEKQTQSSRPATMGPVRVVPHGKLYQQIFDAQSYLSTSLHERRRKQGVHANISSDIHAISSDMITGSHQHPLSSQTRAEQSSEEPRRSQVFSEMKPISSESQRDHEEVRKLPECIVLAQTDLQASHERIMDKKQREHMETISQLYGDLTAVRVGYESLLRDNAEEFLRKFSAFDEEMDRLMKKVEHSGDLGAFTYQELHEIWNAVCHQSSIRRKCIQDFDELFVKHETERAAEIAEILKKYTTKLEKTCYVMTTEVQRLIDNETMLINQALLANRRALAKLHLNLREKDLQNHNCLHIRWEKKLQDWKTIKMEDVVGRFIEFINSPEIRENVENTLKSMQTKQNDCSEERLEILKQVRQMTPPNSLKPSVEAWYTCLSSADGKMHCINTQSIKILRGCYEDMWQICAVEVERLKDELSTYGFTPKEIQDIANREMVPLIGKSQTQAEDHIAVMERAFEGLAKTAVVSSETLFKFVYGAAEIWEAHIADLKMTKEQLQDCLDEVINNYEERNLEKEANLALMLDKLRQESTKKDLKAALKEALIIVDEIKEGYIDLHKKEVDTIEGYPMMVLKEIHAYSAAVSQYFSVKEIYSQDPEELQKFYPSLILVTRSRCNKRKKAQSGNLHPNVRPQSLTPDSAHAERVRDPPKNETFTSVKGNVYNCAVIEYDDAEEDLNVAEAEAAQYPKSLLPELQRDVREKFFNHLEGRYEEVLDHTLSLMEFKKAKLNSELNFRLQLKMTRAKRIETDIHNFRADELIQHKDHVERHNKEILQVLNDLRTDFTKHQIIQHKKIEDFHNKVTKMEEMIYSVTISKKLDEISASVQHSLSENTNDICVLQRQFRQHLEIRFKHLRDINVRFLRQFRLFCEGGNYSPQEIEKYSKCLDNIDNCIDSEDFDLVREMEDIESKCMNENNKVVNKFQEKLQFRKEDLMFVEQIHRVLTNTKVKMKSEVINSNSNSKTINKLIRNLQVCFDAYNQRNQENKVSTGDFIGVIFSMVKEIRKRSQYLDYYQDRCVAAPLSHTPFQSRRQQKVGENGAADPLLMPSGTGGSFIEDKAVKVIKELLRQDSPALRHVQKVPTIKSSYSEPVKPVRSQRSQSGQLSRLTRFNRRLFGLKPELNNMCTYKGVMNKILWEANNLLLQEAENFYKKRRSRKISQPHQIKENFEHFAEDTIKKLLEYQKQCEVYHHNCIKEFSVQLGAAEEIACKIPEVLLTELRDEHLEELSASLSCIRQQFKETQCQSEQKKSEHSKKLNVLLDDPVTEELNGLITAEDERQEERRRAIGNNRVELKACIKKNASKFMTALTTMTEKLLVQFENIRTDDILEAEPKAEKIKTLSRRSPAGTLKERHKKGSRARPGASSIRTTGGSSLKEQKERETATTATANITKSQCKVIEVQNALHQSYEQRIMEELKVVEKSWQEHEEEFSQWQEQWRQEIMMVSTLKSESESSCSSSTLKPE